MNDRWVRASSDGNLSGVVLIDLSAAFDLVNHELLLKKLRIYGVQEDFLNWIKSYLNERYQAVWISHVLSEYRECNVGVPQGSNLGPLFLLIFFNNMPDYVQSAVDSYADDTTVTASGKSLEEIETQLNNDCQEVCSWMKSNELKLNPEKPTFCLWGLKNVCHLSKDQ